MFQNIYFGVFYCYNDNYTTLNLNQTKSMFLLVVEFMLFTLPQPSKNNYTIDTRK